MFLLSCVLVTVLLYMMRSLHLFPLPPPPICTPWGKLGMLPAQQKWWNDNGTIFKRRRRRYLLFMTWLRCCVIILEGRIACLLLLRRRLLQDSYACTATHMWMWYTCMKVWLDISEDSRLTWIKLLEYRNNTSFYCTHFLSIISG